MSIISQIPLTVIVARGGGWGYYCGGGGGHVVVTADIDSVYGLSINLSC